MRLAAASTTAVLVVGEAGTGKRLVARTIHQNGAQRHQPLVLFDCEALPVEILERELFAPAQRREADIGLPVGASGTTRPRLSLRDGSTLLFREILMLPRDLQERLAASLDTSIRLLATTTIDPATAWESEQIRPELYFTLTTLVIHLQPFANVAKSCPSAQHLLERANERGGRQKGGFSSAAISTLTAYDWPGNLRELARSRGSAHAHSEGESPGNYRRPARIHSRPPGRRRIPHRRLRTRRAAR